MNTTSVLSALPLALLLLAGCSQGVSAPGAGAPTVEAAAPADEHAGHDHAGAKVLGHEGHDHEAEAEGADLDRPLDEIFSKTTRCEHGVPTYTCDECRYEVGVVKAAADVVGSSAFATERAERRALSASRDTTGEIALDENRSAFIGPPAAGIVRAVHVDLGDRVRAGQVLFEVEAAELGEARATHAKAHAAVELARTTLRREEELFAKRICPEKDVLEARAALAQAAAEEAAAHQRLEALGVADRDIDAGDDRTRGGRRMPVRAPFDGVVLERDLHLGALVEPGARNLLLADTANVWVKTTVHERELAAILEQQRRGPVAAEVVVPAFGARTFGGRVAAVSGTVDQATRTATARVVVPNPDGLLRPGLFAQVRLAVDGTDGGLTLPAEAVLEDAGRTFVFVRHDGEYFVRRPVTTGRRTGDRIEITSGLHGGETVVTKGAFLFKSDVLRSKMGAGCAD